MIVISTAVVTVVDIHDLLYDSPWNRGITALPGHQVTKDPYQQWYVAYCVNDSRPIKHPLKPMLPAFFWHSPELQVDKLP